MELKEHFEVFYRQNQNFFMKDIPESPIYKPHFNTSEFIGGDIYNNFLNMRLTKKQDVVKDFPFNFNIKNYSEGLSNGDLDIIESSGTSANRIQIVRPNNFRSMWSSRVKQFYRGEQPDNGDREALLTTMNCSRTQCNLPVSSYEERRYLCYLVLNRRKNPTLWTDAECRRMIEEIDRFRPSILTAHPVYLAYLDNWCGKMGIEHPRVDEVSLSYDFSSKIHKRIAKRWARKNVSVCYGLTEVFTASIQCDYDTGHVVTDGLFLEILKNDRPAALNDIGEIVITSARNPVMPMLRYRTGDLSSFISFRDACPCGRKGMKMGRIEGRISELTVSSDNQLITTAMLDDVVSAVKGIMLYQVAQDTEKNVTIKVVPDQFFSNSMSKVLRESIMNLYQSSKVNVVIVPEVIATPTGKYLIVTHTGLEKPAEQMSQLAFLNKASR